MEIRGSSRNSNVKEFEEANILAILNTSGPKHTKDANEDRISFIDAVRAASILSENGTPPSNKMVQEVFNILRIGKTLELMMASYQLLLELDKSFPRVYVSNMEKLSSGVDSIAKLVVVKEDWTPFALRQELLRQSPKSNQGSIDSYGFQILIQDLVELVNETNFQNYDIESLRNLLLFQYLVNVLESDFLPRNITYEGTMDWSVLKESLICMLLGSRKINFKILVKDCLIFMCRLSVISATFSDDMVPKESSTGESEKNIDMAVSIALLELVKSGCIAMQKFFTIVMEFDASKKKADSEGSTTRSDGLRTPIMDLILDELTYNSDILHPFLQAYNEPKWKLEVVQQYLWKYIAKPSVRTRRTNSPPNDLTFRAALKCLSNNTSTRSTIKKIGTEEIQLLLVHGFQAHLSLPSKLSDESTASGSEESRSYTLIELCEDIISAFKSLRGADKNIEIQTFGKEALFTAATIISTKS